MRILCTVVAVILFGFGLIITLLGMAGPTVMHEIHGVLGMQLVALSMIVILLAAKTNRS